MSSDTTAAGMYPVFMITTICRGISLVEKNRGPPHDGRLVEGSYWSDVGTSRWAKVLGAHPASHEEVRHARILAVHAKGNSRGRSRVDRSLKRRKAGLVQDGECANVEANFFQLGPLVKNTPHSAADVVEHPEFSIAWPTTTRVGVVHRLLIIDLFSRYVVRWLLAEKENSVLAERLFATPNPTPQPSPSAAPAHQPAAELDSENPT